MGLRTDVVFSFLLFKRNPANLFLPGVFVSVNLFSLLRTLPFDCGEFIETASHCQEHIEQISLSKEMTNHGLI